MPPDEGPPPFSAPTPGAPRPPARPTRPAPAFSPLADRSRPGKQTAPRLGEPIPPPLEPPAPKRRINRVGIALAVVVCLGMIPFTYEYQKRRAFNATQKGTDYDIPPEKRQWRMHGIDGITEKQAITRFGQPYIARNFNLSDGDFVGPEIGLKHFYLKTTPDFQKRIDDAEVDWGFPQYALIREMIWQLPDSYLTIWFREPRAEVSLEGDNSQIILPPAAEDGGDWISIDNFRVGKDLLKTPPQAAPSASPDAPQR